MATFDTAYEAVQTNEGWSGTPATDNDGGTVRYGINSNAFPDMPGGFYSGEMDDVTALAVAKAHYFNVEWKGVQADKIADQAVACSLFDMAVNAGVGGAIIVVQAVVRLRFDPTLEPDGQMGPETLAAINAAGSPLGPALGDARAGWYALASLKPTGKGWLKGWLGRIVACEKETAS